MNDLEERASALKAENARLRKALDEYITAVIQMHAAMKDGINVHGAMMNLMAREEIARAALQPAKEPR